jgi:glycosyltransferase involved in cell wall biosynthesis
MLASMMTKREEENVRAGGRPRRIHVCIDQEIGAAKATGLVRTWLNILREAPGHEDLDLTLHAPASVARVQSIASNARIVEHAVRFRLRRWLERRGVESAVPWIVGPYLPSLARELAAADVIQTTSTHLALSMTGWLVARRRGIPLVNALQTDAPAYAEIDARTLARHVLRGPLRRRLAPDPAACGRYARRAVERQIAWYLRACALTFVSAPTQTHYMSLAGPAARAAFLPRGIDARQFAPIHRDRSWLAQRYGIARDEPVVLYVGRLGAEKSPTLLAQALQRLAARGERFTLLVCGNGPERAEIADLLPGRAIFAGFQPHDTLRKIYASSDLFAFPSATECFANVVVEAMSSGLPTLVSALGGARQHVASSDQDGVVVATQTVEDWAAAIRALLRDDARRAQIGQRARARILDHYPSWATVMAEAVKPGWIAAAATPRPAPRVQRLARPWMPARLLSGV